MWDAEKEKYYFSVADIVQVLTDSADVKQYIKRMRARDAELNSKWGTLYPCCNVGSRWKVKVVLPAMPAKRWSVVLAVPLSRQNGLLTISSPLKAMILKHSHSLKKNNSTVAL